MTDSSQQRLAITGPTVANKGIMNERFAFSLESEPIKSAVCVFPVVLIKSWIKTSLCSLCVSSESLL